MFLSFQTFGQTGLGKQCRPGSVWSRSTLFAIPSASFGCISLRKSHLVQLLGWLQQISNILGFLRHIMWSPSNTVKPHCLNLRIITAISGAQYFLLSRHFRSLTSIFALLLRIVFSLADKSNSVRPRLRQISLHSCEWKNRAIPLAPRFPSPYSSPSMVCICGSV